MRIFIPLVFLFACSTVPAPAPVPEPSPSPTARITLTCDRTCTAHEREKVAKAEAIINEIRTRPCFQDMFLKPELSSQLVQTGGRTREEVVQDLATREARATVTYYWRPGKVVGYRNPGSSVIHFNRYIHGRKKNDNEWMTASNGFHEVSHVMGYTHDYKPTKRRPYSVSYRINRAVERCEREMGE